MDRNNLHFMQPDLFPDLDWMLQSSQVEDGEILQVIVREHLTNLFQFAQVVLEDDNLAFRAACDTIVLAVNRRHRYLGEQSGRSWLNALAWEVIWRLSLQRKWKGAFFWRRKEYQPARLSGSEEIQPSSDVAEVSRNVQDLTPIRKAFLYLSEQMKFSEEEISLICGRKPRIVQKELEFIHSRLGFLPEDNLSTIPQALWPLPHFDPAEIEEAFGLIRDTVFLQKKRSSSTRSIKMAGLGAVFILPILLFLSFGPKLLRDEKHPGNSSQGIDISKPALPYQSSDGINNPVVEADMPPRAMPPVLFPERTLLDVPDPTNFSMQGESYHRLLTQPGLKSLAAVLQFWQGAWNYPALVRIFNYLIPETLGGSVMLYDLGDTTQMDRPLYGQLRHGGEPETLKHLLVAGFPVIIQKEPQTSSMNKGAGQFETVIGFDNMAKIFYFLDFSENKVKPEAVPYDQFIEEWRSFNYTYLVIFPPTLERNFLKALGEDVDGIGN